MNGLDLAVGLALVAATVSGYRQGLLSRICTVVGSVGGLLLVAANLRWVVARLPIGDRRPGLVGVLIALGLGAIVGRIAGVVIGRWLRRRLPTHPVRQADRLGGAGLGAAGVAVVVWLAAPLFALVPGWPSAMLAGSRSGALVAKRLPAPPNAVGSLRFLLDNASFPQVLSSLLPGFRAQNSVLDGVGTHDVALAASVGRGAAESTVSVTARACGMVSRGTGVVVAKGLVVTNAHVVAGAIGVDIGDAEGAARTVVSGRVVWADAAVDLALIRVDAPLVAQVMEVVAGESDPQRAVVVGRPHRTARLLPARVTTVITANGRDIYDKAKVQRRVLVLAVDVAPGDSGGPVVDRQGRLIGLVFAAAADMAGTGFALPADSVRLAVRQIGSGMNTARRCLR